MTALNDPLRLRSGKVIPNRLAKAAMQEQLAGPGRLPDARITRLYRRWATGVGLVITGHVMVDRRAVSQPGDIVLEADSDLTGFVEWAAAARSGGAQVWMQINHPGRVVLPDTQGLVWAPSAVAIDAGKFSGLFTPPVSMSEQQIQEVIGRFAATARGAAAAGFDGVEVHAAHGYLISQFLSPLVNRRTDAWGGSLENRSRLLLEIVRAVRSATRPDFSVAVKLNSADFQRGGFEIEDAFKVITLLEENGVDLVELSGGSIESLATSGTPSDGRTLAREAYFLEMAGRLVRTTALPLMLTGGIRRRAVAHEVLEAGFAVVGLATAMAIEPDAPRAWLEGNEKPVTAPRSTLPSKFLRAAAVQASITCRLHRLASGRLVNGEVSPWKALVSDRVRRSGQLRDYLRERHQGGLNSKVSIPQ